MLNDIFETTSIVFAEKLLHAVLINVKTIGCCTLSKTLSKVQWVDKTLGERLTKNKQLQKLALACNANIGGTEMWEFICKSK